MATDLEDFGSGWQKWNLQAWFDFVMIKMMMSKVGDVIPKTYVPILRLVAEDKGKVDDEYARVLALREPVRLFDSPRDKWRKMYGSYIRELDWVYGELRKYFPKEEYEELVVDIMARNMRDAMSSLLPNVEKMTRTGDSGAAARDQRKKSGVGRYIEKMFAGPIGSWMFEHMNPMSPIVGPVEMKTPPGKNMEIFIPVCWMHTAPGDGRTQDEACLQGCKGACERVFNGNTPISMYFDPHLPDYACTITVSLGDQALPAGAATGD